MNRKISRDLPYLKITRWIGEDCDGCVADAIESKYIADAATDMFCGDEKIRCDGRSEKAAELAFVLPSAAGQRTAWRTRIRDRIAGTEKNYRARRRRKQNDRNKDRQR